MTPLSVFISLRLFCLSFSIWILSLAFCSRLISSIFRCDFVVLLLLTFPLLSLSQNFCILLSFLLHLRSAFCLSSSSLAPCVCSDIHLSHFLSLSLSLSLSILFWASVLQPKPFLFVLLSPSSSTSVQIIPLFLFFVYFLISFGAPLAPPYMICFSPHLLFLLLFLSWYYFLLSHCICFTTSSVQFSATFPLSSLRLFKRNLVSLRVCHFVTLPAF